MKNITILVNNDFNERVPEGVLPYNWWECLSENEKIIIKPLRETNLGEAQV